jgi:hypothetical protein
MKSLTIFALSLVAAGAVFAANTPTESAAQTQARVDGLVTQPTQEARGFVCRDGSRPTATQRCQSASLPATSDSSRALALLQQVQPFEVLARGFVCRDGSRPTATQRCQSV